MNETPKVRYTRLDFLGMPNKVLVTDEDGVPILVDAATLAGSVAFAAPESRFDEAITNLAVAPIDLVATLEAIRGGVDPEQDDLLKLRNYVDSRTITGLNLKTTGYNIQYQASHGFAKGDILRHSVSTPGNRSKALAANTLTPPATNLETNQEVCSIVTAIGVDDLANYFTEFTGAGFVDITGLLDQAGAALVTGTPYYLSATVAGKLTASAPALSGQAKRYVLRPISTTVGMFTSETDGEAVADVVTILNSDTNGLGSLSADAVLSNSKRTYVVNSSSGVRTVTLPPVSDFPANAEVFYCISRSGANNVVVAPSAGDTLVGGNLTLISDAAWVIVRRTATAEWRVFSSYSIPPSGTATLVAGSVTVSEPNVAAGSRIFCTINTPGGTPGFISAPVASISPGVGFVINSSSNTDTSTINYRLG